MAVSGSFGAGNRRMSDVQTELSLKQGRVEFFWGYSGLGYSGLDLRPILWAVRFMPATRSSKLGSGLFFSL